MISTEFKSDLICLILFNSALLNIHYIVSISIVHPHHDQSPPLDALFQFLDKLCVLPVRLVIFGELICGDLKGAFLCIANLFLRFQLCLKVRLQTTKRHNEISDTRNNLPSNNDPAIFILTLDLMIQLNLIFFILPFPCLPIVTSPSSQPSVGSARRFSSAVACLYHRFGWDYFADDCYRNSSRLISS